MLGEVIAVKLIIWSHFFLVLFLYSADSHLVNMQDFVVLGLLLIIQQLLSHVPAISVIDFIFVHHALVASNIHITDIDVHLDVTSLPDSFDFGIDLLSSVDI